MHIGTFDLLAEHTGTVEARTIADLFPSRSRSIAVISLPVYTDTERKERVANGGSPPAPPSDDGSHLVDLWSRRISIRNAPCNFAVAQRKTVDELISAGPHLACPAVFEYPTAETLSAIRQPLVVFAPHDDLIEQTERGKCSLPPHAVYVDIPDLRMDITDTAPERFASLIIEHLGDDR